MGLLVFSHCCLSFCLLVIHHMLFVYGSVGVSTYLAFCLSVSLLAFRYMQLVFVSVVVPSYAVLYGSVGFSSYIVCL